MELITNTHFVYAFISFQSNDKLLAEMEELCPSFLFT